VKTALSATALGVAMLTGYGLSAPPAQAGYIVTLEQVGEQRRRDRKRRNRPNRPDVSRCRRRLFRPRYLAGCRRVIYRRGSPH
jgi:hypothetical protein